MGYHWIYWNVFFFCVSQYQENVMIFFDVLRIPQTFSPFAPFRFSRSGSLRPPLRPPLKGTPASASDSALLRSLRFISLTSKSLSGSAKVKKDHHIVPDISKHKKKNVSTYPVISHFSPDILSFSDEFWRKLFEIASLCHSEGISKNTENRQKILTQPYGFYNLWPLKS